MDLLITLWVLSVPIALVVGIRRGEPLGAVWLTLLLGPLGLLIAIFKPTDPTKVKKATKQCPQCAEQVLADARICRYCTSDLTSPAPTS